MRPPITFYVCLAAIFSLLGACNPDCESITTVTAEIQPQFRRAGEEIMIRTDPSDFLRDRPVFIAVNNGNDQEFVELEAVFHEDAGGCVAKLPENLAETGNQTLFVKDEDCGGFLPLNSVRVVDDLYINNNPEFFVVPSPPIIILPSPPIPAPTNVINTWFSPDRPAYCIWFFPTLVAELDANGDTICVKESTNLLAGNFDDPDNPGTRELNCVDATSFDHANIITGSMNAATGQVRISIDRTSKGLGVEDFIGNFVDPEDLPESYRSGTFCDPDVSGSDETPRQTIILLTSELTGRQLILYRHVGGTPIPDNLCPPE